MTAERGRSQGACGHGRAGGVTGGVALLVGLTALAAPAAALAGPACWGQTHDNRVAGVVSGAGAEAVLAAPAIAPGRPMAGGAALTCLALEEAAGPQAAPSAVDFGSDSAVRTRSRPSDQPDRRSSAPDRKGNSR